MYIGHIGVALGAKGWRKALPLSALVLAAQGPDWIETIFYAGRLGSDRAELWSHSLLSVAVITIVIAALAAIRWRSAASALMLGVIYALHLPADYLTGYKPLWDGGPHIGMRLYDRPLLDFALEAIVISVGWSLWRRSLPEKGRDRPAAWLLLAGLIALQIAADFVFEVRSGTWY